MAHIKSHRTPFLTVSVFLGIIVTLFNYSFGNNDHIEQLPIIYRTLDADYLTNDFFVNSNAGFSPRYYYSKFVGFLGFLIGIPLFFFIGTLLSNIAVSILTYLCAKTLFKNELTGIIASAMVMVMPTIALGGDLVLYASMFTPTTLVFPMILLAFYFFLKEKMLLCVLTTGVASIFHVLIGFEYGVLFLFVSIILDIIQKKGFKIILKKLSLFVVILVFLLPNLIPHFQQNTVIESSLFIEIVAKFRHPHHYILGGVLPGADFLKLFIIEFIILITFGIVKRNITEARHLKSIETFTILFSLGAGLSFIFVEGFPTKLVTTLQFLRLLNFGKWLLLILVSYFIALEISKRKFNLRNRLTIILFGLLILMSGISIAKIILSITLFSFLIFLSYRQKKKNFTVISTVLIGLILILNVVNISKLGPYQKKYLSSKGLTNTESELSKFIQSNTEKNSVFLAPHLFGFLRTETKRAIVVDFKAFPFQEGAMQEWYQRIKDCYGLDTYEFEEVYKSVTDEKILQLQQKYHFNYAVLHEETQTKIPTIYSNSEYKIIDLASYAQ